LATHRSYSAVEAPAAGSVAESASGRGGGAQPPLAHGAQTTSWSSVLLLFAAGCSVSLNTGKVPAALPVITDDLNLSVFQSGLLVGLFSVMIATVGLLTGLAAARIGYRSAACGGVWLAAIAGILAWPVESFAGILFLRTLEGFGWVLVAVSMPVLMTACASSRDHPLVLGLWGAFVPIGIIIALLYSPTVIRLSDWRGLWLFTGLLGVVAALAVHRPSGRLALPQAKTFSWQEVRGAVIRPVVLAMGVCFLAYSALFVISTAFFPLILVEQHGVSLGMAGALAALTMVGSVAGNVAAGWLIRRGVSRYRLLYFALLVGGLSTLGIFLDGVPLAMRVMGCFVFTSCSGLVPGSLFASVPVVVSQVAHIGLVNGVIMQSAGMGQLAGPLVQTGMVDLAGSWSWSIVAILLFVVIALGAVRTFELGGP